MIRLEVEYDDGTRGVAGLYEVCEWFVQTYPDDVFVSKDHPVHVMRDRAKDVLALRKGVPVTRRREVPVPSHKDGVMLLFASCDKCENLMCRKADNSDEWVHVDAEVAKRCCAPGKAGVDE